MWRCRLRKYSAYKWKVINRGTKLNSHLVSHIWGHVQSFHSPTSRRPDGLQHLTFSSLRSFTYSSSDTLLQTQDPVKLVNLSNPPPTLLHPFVPSSLSARPHSLHHLAVKALAPCSFLESWTLRLSPSPIYRLLLIHGESASHTRAKWTGRRVNTHRQATLF